MITLQVGVKAFLRNSDGKFLLMRRNKEKYSADGSWDIVGGRIEPGTALLDNLKREVDEETRLSIVSLPKLVSAQDIIPSEDRHIVRLSYVADCEGKVILDTSENIEYKWVSIDELRAQEDLDIYVKELVEKNLI